MTSILFIHPNFPGQFKHIIAALQQRGDYQLGYICRRRSIRNGEGILFAQYDYVKQTKSGIHRFLNHTQEAVREAGQVLTCMENLVDQGFQPDIVIGHTGWGGLLFVKDRFPDARVIAYCELYFSAEFDHAALPGKEPETDRKLQLRCRNLHTLMQMEIMDRGITPTAWQLQSHPKTYHQKMVSVHEGVDTTLCRPDHHAKFPVIDKGLNLSRDDTVITYVSRGFEPTRGFFEYVQALEILCRELPEAHFLMVGGENSFYSGDAGDKSFKQQALEKYDIDHQRVHFTGRLIHEGFRKVIQISSAHVYLTRPLFMSWSAVEAMSMGAPIVAADEALVREFIRHEREGLLVDHYNPRAIADAVIRLLQDNALAARLGQQARDRIVQHYDINDTVARWMEVIRSVE